MFLITSYLSENVFILNTIPKTPQSKSVPITTKLAFLFFIFLCLRVNLNQDSVGLQIKGIV